MYTEMVMVVYTCTRVNRNVRLRGNNIPFFLSLVFKIKFLLGIVGNDAKMKIYEGTIRFCTTFYDYYS